MAYANPEPIDPDGDDQNVYLVVDEEPYSLAPRPIRVRNFIGQIEFSFFL